MVEAVAGWRSSVATWTTCDKPVTTQEAREVYDGWVRDGYAVHTEGGSRVMVTAWQESNAAWSTVSGGVQQGFVKTRSST